MKDSIFQLEDASFEVVKRVRSTGDLSLESYLNVNIKRVKFNVLNATAKVFSDGDNNAEFSNKQSVVGAV